MTNKLIPKTQRRIIEHAGLRQHDRVLQRAAANQPVRLQFFNIVIETERSCRGNEVGIIRPGEFNMKALFPNQRVRKIDIVLYRECFRWINAERLLAILQNEFFSNTNILSRSFLLHDPGPDDRFRIRKRASIQNGNLEIVELDICVVDADAVQRGQKMLNRRNPHAAAHERGRIRHACDRPDISSKLEIIQIDTAQYDALAFGSGKDSKRGILAGVQPNTGELDRSSDRLLVHKWRKKQFDRRSSSYESLTSYKPNTRSTVYICAQLLRERSSHIVFCKC